ncbi:hypothetical protein OG588_40815 [Streptomyces prunicolor]|uniref:hypothetical protein n=1 Tax=Streptomyces prunicolor TaxID=67348 RepID=UPI00386C29E8|nr:hypothetical protein OG588_40815 [Streptomyces prunicolor]
MTDQAQPGRLLHREPYERRLAVTRERGGGRLVNVGAVPARVPPPFFGPIAASRAALAALTHSLRAELGAMDTPVFATAEKAGADLGRAGSPETQRYYARNPSTMRSRIRPARASPSRAGSSRHSTLS